MTMRQQAGQAPLSGLRVLDLSEGVAGPFCTKLMADFGADVLKIEPPAGDWTRSIGPFPQDAPHPEKSGLFLNLNTSKRGRVLDLSSSQNREGLRDLIAGADVLVESYAPALAAKLGLEYNLLARSNPALVMTSITPFGQTGPYRDYPASDFTLTAISGFLYATGEPDREPIAGAGYRSSYMTGYMAYIATLAALRARRETSRGQHVDISAMEATTTILENFTTINAYTGKNWTRQGNRRGHVHPASVYPCRDGFVQAFLLGEDQWQNLCRVIGREDLLGNPRYALNADRVLHADEIDAILIPWFMQRTKEEIENICQKSRITVGMVAEPADLLASLHLAAREFWVEATHPVAGTLPYPGMPFKLPESPGRIRNTAPCLVDGKVQEDTSSRQWISPRPSRQDELPMPQANTKPLAGIRILDLTSAWAGPLTTRTLACLGAEVIKIEGPTRHDISRGRLPPKGFTERYPNSEYGERPWNRNAYFNTLNYNKFDCVLDVTHPRGLELAKRLVTASDVVAENFSARVMGKLGLGYPTLQALNPNIILLSMPGYGLTGPQRDWVAWGPTVEANAGMCHLIGYRDGPPLSSGFNFNDPLSGLTGCAALLTALAHREAGGSAQHIDVSHHETAICLIADTIMDYSMNKRSGGRMGNRHAAWAPQGCYRCAGDDRWIAITIATDDQWQVFCRCIERPDWAADAGLATAAGRRARHDELDAGIADWTRTRERETIWKQLIGQDVLAAPVYSGADLNHDPHLAARRFFTELDHPDCGTYPYPGLGFKLSGTPVGIDRISPSFAEHNDYVFRTLLGLTEREIAELYDLGITSDKPKW